MLYNCINKMSKLIIGKTASGKTAKIVESISEGIMRGNGNDIHIFCCNHIEPLYYELQEEEEWVGKIKFYSIFSEFFIDDFNDVHKLKNVTIVLDDNFGFEYKRISDKLNNLILESFDDCHWNKDHRNVYISAHHLDYVDQRIKEKVDEIIILNRTI